MPQFCGMKFIKMSLSYGGQSLLFFIEALGYGNRYEARDDEKGKRHEIIDNLQYTDMPLLCHYPEKNMYVTIAPYKARQTSRQNGFTF